MESLLLVLVLFSDPTAQPMAKLIADDLAMRGGASTRVLIGPEALKALETRGLRDGDLVNDRRLGEQLTRHEPSLVILRVDYRVASGDRVVDTQIWCDGRSERHTAIGGKGADPTSSAVAGVVGILGTRLGSAPPAAPSGGAPVSGADLPTLSQRQAWSEIAARLAPKTDKDARDYYYLVLAQVRLRDAAAKDTLAAMGKAFPNHFLYTTATELIPVAPVEQPGETRLDQ